MISLKKTDSLLGALKMIIFTHKNSGLEDTKFKKIAQLDELPKRSNSRQKMFSMHKMLFVKNLF